MIDETKQEKQNNVWYRHVLKPLIRQTHAPVSYRKAFLRHIPHTVDGIPVVEVAGLTSIFRPNFRQYTPLTGVIFGHNHLIENLYRFGDATTDPAVRLVRNLFVQLPGGEICPTHAGHQSGAHLSPALMGDLFAAWEQAKQQSEEAKDLAETFARVMREDPGYQNERDRLRDNVAQARETLRELKNRYDQCKPIMEEIKRIQGDVIKRNRHERKRLQRKLQSVTREQEQKFINEEMDRLDADATQGEIEIVRLRSLIIPKLEVKAAEKSLHRAEQAVEMEQTNLIELTEILANSFCKYETDNREEVPRFLFKYATTAILLAFMWQKYDSARSLKGYFESMGRLGALRCSIGCVLNMIEPRNGFNSERCCVECPAVEPVPLSNFDSLPDIERAVIVTVGKPGVARRPPVVPFSYVTWAAYSEFPDCGETALRNLINQLVFVDKNGLQYFDHEILLELREKYFPNLQLKLVEFYRTHPNPQEAIYQSAGRDWLEVTYRLNEGRDEADGTIRYRRPREQKNIASPLKNLMRAFNVLFGIEPLNWQGGIVQVVKHINELRGSSLLVDLSRIHQDGFGVLKITDGSAHYELQSYKPVHFSFVQTENMHSTRIGRQEFCLFRKLMRYSCTKPRAEVNKLAYFEQLMLASLFVPYQLKRGKVKAFFRKNPIHLALLFADLNSPRSKEITLTYVAKNWPRQARVGYLAQLLDNIYNYEEPSFRPPSAKKKHDESRLTSECTDDCTVSQ